MSNLPSSHVFNGDPVADGADQSFGDAFERVYGAGQELIVRRIDLLVEELAAQGRSLLAAAVGKIFAAMAAAAQWRSRRRLRHGDSDDDLDRETRNVVIDCVDHARYDEEPAH